MSIYANGLRININEVVKLEFLDGVQGDTKVVGTFSMTLETFKSLRDASASVIEEHAAKVAKIAKSN